MIPLGVLASARAASGPWTPAGLPGLAAWFDASDTATITETAGRVSQWADKSGNGRHVTQDTAALKPYTAARTQNGLNVLDFRANSWLSRESVTITSPATVAVAYAVDNTSPPYTYFGGLNKTSGFGVIGKAAGSVFIALGQGSSLPHTQAYDTTARAHIAILAATSTTYTIDGVTVSGARSGSATGAGIYIGAWDANTYKLDGMVAEVVICSAALSVGDVAALGSYLKAKWGTP